MLELMVMSLSKSKPQESGFALIPELILVALVAAAVIVGIFLALHHSKTASDSNPVCQGLGPCAPSKAKYLATGAKDIPAVGKSASADLAHEIASFSGANTGLQLEATSVLDGCGLFSTKSNGDFAAAVGKVCSISETYYYSSSTDSVAVGSKLADWLGSVVGSSNVYGYYQKPCSQIGGSSAGSDLQSLDVYALTKPAGDSSCEYARLPANVSLAQNLLAGYDGDYVDVLSEQKVDAQALLTKLRSEGKNTLVVVSWSKGYYKYQY